MMKYIVAAFIAMGAMLSVSAQAAPLSPASVQTEQAIATGVAVEKVCWGGGCGGWGGGGWGGRLGWWRLGKLRLLPALLASLRLLRLWLWRSLVAGPSMGLGRRRWLGRRLGWRLGPSRLGWRLVSQNI